MPSAADTQWIVDRAKSLGFDLCGVVRAEKFPELERFAEWLACGYAGEMSYLADARRANPQQTMPEIHSVIVCLLNYNTAHPLSTDPRLPSSEEEPRGWISRYAWGRDYHDVLREKLNAVVEFLPQRFTEQFEARAYVDTGPLHERVLAKYAGLGWIGKNTLLLNHSLGSFFFLGAILTTLNLEPTLRPGEMPPPDLCGNCRQCLDACPTGAFVEPYLMDARKCISYLTIELRGSIPEELREPMGLNVFGCDICQDVCPWNRQAAVTAIPDFQPRAIASQKNPHDDKSALPHDESLLLPRLEWLARLSEAEFREVFRGSAIKRTKWRGLVRNACIALGNSDVPRGTPGHARICAVLEQLAASEEKTLAESALWALTRIQ